MTARMVNADALLKLLYAQEENRSFARMKARATGDRESLLEFEGALENIRTIKGWVEEQLRAQAAQGRKVERLCPCGAPNDGHWPECQPGYGVGIKGSH